MKLSLTLSSVMHMTAIGLALLSISGPSPLVAVEQQGIEVDFAADSSVPPGRGEERAEVDPEPAPLPSKRPETVPDAENVGEANEDSPSREGIVNERTLDTEKTSAAPEAEEVNNSPVVREDPVTDGDVSETPVPTNEVASLNQPKVPVEEELSEETAEPTPETPSEPDEITNVPVPVQAPANRPKPKSPQTKERREPEETRPQETASSREQQKEITDRIGNLLNTAETTAGGAKRQERVASIGSDTPQNAPKLTRGEYDALKARIGQCWSIPMFVDSEALQVVLDMRMSRDGELSAITDIRVSGVSNPAHVRAVEGALARNLENGRCPLSDVLPREKYETWKEVRVNFQPQDF